MQINTDVSIGMVNDASVAHNIERKLAGLKITRAVEAQDLKLLQGAMSACARREATRKTAKTGEKSAEAEAAEAKAEELREREVRLESGIEVGEETLRLLR